MPVTPRPPSTGLPAEDVVEDVRRAMVDPGKAVLVAPPGAGKTTVVPLRLLGEAWLGDGRIVMLEPRRLAARAAAQRMAELLGEPVGRTVGYRTRDEKRVSAQTRIEVITEGILVRRLQRDPSLDGTSLVILDEVHERNLVTDLSLALLLDAQRALRPDLRVLAMSATVDTTRLSTAIGGPDGPVPVIESDGRHHPVAIHWRPRGPGGRLEQAVASVVAEAVAAEPDGDVLVFLPGAFEIDRTVRALSGLRVGSTPIDVWPLYGALPVDQQDRALAPSPPGRRRVVVATDIAESSLTVAGVRIVVDAGQARGPRFDPGTGLTRLVTIDGSQASAHQRAGRAGRLGPGAAYRLWSEVDHLRRAPFAEPEITVTDLAGLALEVAVWGSDLAELTLLDAPPAPAWSEATTLLTQLGALDPGGRPTPTGRAMADVPLHPRLARMVVDGNARGLGWAAATMAAALDERDVLAGPRRDRPTDVALRVAAVDGGPVEAGRVSTHGARSARRRAKEIARRVGAGRTTIDPGTLGPLLALAYPDRIAQARGRGRFRLRSGGGGWLAETDPLAGAPFLAVADLDVGDGDGPIRSAALLDAEDVRDLVGDDLDAHSSLTWSTEADDLRVRREVRAGTLVLESHRGRAEPGPETVAALLDRVRATGGAVLNWSARVRALQARLQFLHRHDPDRWPDVDDGVLLASLDQWLGPHLVSATGRRDLTAVDLAVVLQSGLDHHAQRDLDRLAPTRVTLANGRSLSVGYGAEAGPTVEARVQDLFGTDDHPTVLDGRVPVVMDLLSPARRSVQVTSDLPGFWRGSWTEVRKDMAGRYPKHPWPEHPENEAPPVRRARRSS